MTKLNPGIVQVVQLLNDVGYSTTDSGDGETHDFECDRDVGYVVIRLDKDSDLVADCEDIAKILTELGIDLTSGVTQICGSYDPMNKIKLIDIHNISDKMLNI